MNPIEMSEIGEVIRKVRKERGLRLEDLADENISPATVSNIERGVPHVSPTKIQYLMEKLGLDMNQLPELLKDEQQKLQDLWLTLQSIESKLDLGVTEGLWDQLRGLDLDDAHPFAAYYYYLRGKYQKHRRNWKRAEREFSNAIRLADQSDEGKQENIEAASFNELALCSYYQNNLEQAIRYTENGIEAFQPDQGRRYYKYILMTNKAAYLEKAGRYEEALRAVQELWNHLPEIQNISVVLYLYELRAVLLRRSGMYDEAIRFAQEGLEIARINKQFDRSFDLWSALGSVYMAKKEWKKAEICYRTALSLKGTFEDEAVFVSAYADLGTLYMLQEKWEEAEEALSQAIELGRSLNDALRLVGALLVMGECKQKQQQFQQAIPYLEEALSLTEKYGYKQLQYDALFLLSRSWEQVDRDQFSKTIEQMYQVQVDLKQQEGQSLLDRI
jgi:tetratricopeptide (TPR) repeat protein